MTLSIPLIIADAVWFDTDKLPLFIAVLCAVGIVLYVTSRAKQGIQYSIRPIAGLKAVDDAIGRATEMNRPVLFTPGWGGDIQRPTTIAAMNILGNITERTAQYDCRLLFATHDPVILAVAQEVIKEGYAKAGYPDRFRADDAQYVSSSQFGYAAAVDGIIVRQKPASIFLLGTFEAESLILAETGNAIGAIQIAGTDSTIQLAFFIVACDFTLIGEELFAASGYLSGNASILASVRAQDILKTIIAALLILAVLSATLTQLGIISLPKWWAW